MQLKKDSIARAGFYRVRCPWYLHLVFINLLRFDKLTLFDLQQIKERRIRDISPFKRNLIDMKKERKREWGTPEVNDMGQR